jgi:N-acetylglucosamine kinase-like BadF-type ATPase
MEAAPCDGVFFGMAGVVSTADQAIVHDIARSLGLGGAVQVDHDIRIALAGGLSGRPGIALIAGTGSSCFGINAAGERWQAGGWGHLISDEGSSYWFGWNAIRLAAGACDGRWETTRCGRRCCASLGSTTSPTCISGSTARASPKLRLPRLPRW